VIQRDDRIELRGHKGTVRRVYDDGYASVRFDSGSAGNIAVTDLTKIEETSTKQWPPPDLETKAQVER
jgi:hypothetical protein